MRHVVYIARGPRGALRIGRGGCSGRGRPPGSYRLVYFEAFATLGDAISRERQLKGWERPWQDELVEGVNPGWRDLTGTLCA